MRRPAVRHSAEWRISPLMILKNSFFQRHYFTLRIWLNSYVHYTILRMGPSSFAATACGYNRVKVPRGTCDAQKIKVPTVIISIYPYIWIFIWICILSEFFVFSMRSAIMLWKYSYHGHRSRCNATQTRDYVYHFCNEIFRNLFLKPQNTAKYDRQLCTLHYTTYGTLRRVQQT